VALSAAMAADFPAASYKASNLPYTVSFDGNGQFHVDQGEKQQVAGSYTVKADQITLTDAKGPWACTKSGEQTGTYHWIVDGGALHLSLVSDKCADRVNSLVNLRWQRQ
jgi:hypothetical protein